MPYIRVRSQSLKGVSVNVQRISRRMDKIEQQFSSISNRLDWDVKNEQMIDAMLRQISRELESEEWALYSLGEFLERSAQKYEALEHTGKNSYAVGGRYTSVINMPSPGENTETEERESLMERISNWFKGLSETADSDAAGLVSDISEYFDKLCHLFSGEAGSGQWMANWCDLAKTSSAVEKSIYDVYSKLLEKNEKVLEAFTKKYGRGMAYLDVAGNFVGYIGSVYKASKNRDIMDMSEVGKSAVDVGKAVYLAANAVNPDERILMNITKGKGINAINASKTADIKKYNQNAKWTSHVYASLVKGGTDFAAQTIKSVGEYSKDGHWSMGDTGATGIEASICALNTICSEMTWGIVSFEAMNLTPGEVSHVLETKAEGLGKAAGNYINNDPKLKEEYNNSGAWNRTRMLLWSIGKTGFERMKSHGK